MEFGDQKLKIEDQRPEIAEWPKNENRISETGDQRSIIRLIIKIEHRRLKDWKLSTVDLRMEIKCQKLKIKDHKSKTNDWIPETGNR